MNKNSVLITIANQPIILDKVERGYYNGESRIGTGNMAGGEIGLHVEAIHVKQQHNNTESYTVALNNIYQSVIDNWLIRNDGCIPKLITVGGKKYFINIEVFAS